MEWSFSARNAPTSFVCALLVTLGGGLSVLTPSGQAFASGAATSTPAIVSDTPPTHDATTGAMAGEAGTDGGASSYRIPIVVPPGRAGMQPSLSLSYSSRGGNGIAGLGWSLSGLSSIHRCPQTPEQDGASRGVSYSDTDRLCLDGQRLVKVNSGGNYGDSETIYKTEIDSYARITQLGGNLRSTSTSFKVEQKSGQILSYGATADSKVTPNPVAPLSWLVSKIEDRVGNNQTFTYYTTFGNGENLLESVTYTGSASVSGNRKVQFTYQNRGAQDIASSALAGGLTMQTKALAAIRTSIDGVVIRKYTPSYVQSKYSKRLLMTSLTECGGELPPCHPPSQFTYNDDFMDPALAATPSFQLKSLEGLGLPSPTPLSGEENENYHVRVAGDYDGDGTRETAVSASTGGVTHVYLTQFTADRKAHSPVEIAAPYNQLISAQTSEADMDGSGRSALIGLQLDPTYVAFGLWDYNLFQRGTPATGNPFGKVSTNIRLPESFGVAHGQSKLVLAADVDGDGKTDILTIKPEPSCGLDHFGAKDAVFLHKNNIDSPFSVGQTVNFATEIQLFCLNRIDSRIGFAEESIDHIGDFNGDGLADFYLVYGGAGSSLVGGIAGIRITQPGAVTALMNTCSQIGLVSNGTAIDDCSGNQNYAVRWMDVNADGLEDFVIARPSEGKWKLRLNMGNGTFGAEIDTNSSLGLVADKTGSITGPTSRFRYANRLPSMDVDGDGKTDLLIPSQKPGMQAFAVKMCTIKRVRKIVGGDVPVCPSALGRVIPQSQDPNAPESGEICAAYSCPPNPDGSEPLPSNFTTHGENEGYPYQWNNLPAFSAYNSDLNHDGPGEDNSAYHLAQLKFVQTGPASFSVSSVETAMVSKLSDSSGRSDDVFGDGLPDLMTSIGCSNLIIHQAGSDTDAEWNEQKCSAVTSVNGIAYGPTTLPDNVTTTASLASKVALYANINQGVAAPGGSIGGATFQVSQRPAAPTLIATSGGMSLNLPVPNLPGLMDSAANGVGDFATWGYFPLSVQATQGSVPFYTVRTNGASNGYVDDRHYYFQSSMPTVYGMAQNNGSGGGSGFRSAAYGYTEAMYHHLGRGFQGFHTITSTSAGPSNRQLSTTTTFHQKFPLTGRVDTVESQVPNARRSGLIKRETDIWICDLSRGACPTNGSGGGVFTPLLDKQRVDTFDLGTGVAVSHTETVNAATSSGGVSGWDGNGNLLNQMVTSADDGAGGSFVGSHVVKTTNTYVGADTASWWLDRLSNSHVETTLAFASGRALPNGTTTAPIRTIDTSYGWNSDRTPLSQTVSASGKTLTTTYSYVSTTARGLPSSVSISGTLISPARTTQFSYTKDGTGQATQQDGYFVLTTTNSLLQSSTTEHSTRDGQVTRVIDPNNLKTLNTYDAFGRLTGMSFADASNLELLKPVSIGYCRASSCGSGYGEGDNQSNAAWRVTKVQEGSPTSSEWFDVLGRTIKHVERGFNGDFIEATTDYDSMGTAALQSTPFYQGQVPYFTAWNYDALNRPIEKNAPGAELDPAHGDVKTTYSYNGSKTTIKVRGTGVSATCSATTNLCMDMSRSYDVLGRLEQTVQNNGSTANYATTDYWYDGLGNPLAARDAGSALMTATYNDLGQRTDLYDPDAGHWQLTYNALGEVIDQIDARGVVTSHVYDALGRLTQRTATNTASSDASLKTIRDTWAYDPAGSTGGKGLLDYATRQKGPGTLSLAQIWKESNSYEPSTKRLSSQTSTLDGAAAPWITSYTYDSYGRPFTIGYPSGLMVKKDYTSYGDLRELSNYGTGSIYWTGSTKDAWGNLTAETWAGGITGAHSAFASTGQIQKKKWTQGATQLNQLDYGYDSFGNLTSQSSTLDGVAATESYAYDGLQRLAQTSRTGVAGNPIPVTYRYQNNGNLSAKSDYSFGTQGSYVYGGGSCGPHAVTAVVRAGSSLTYNCDANGNVVGGTALNATYDFNNQPWTINRLNDGSGNAQFAYSANGDVFKTLAGSSNTWFGPAGYEESWLGATLTQRHELGPVVVLRQGGVDTIKAVLRDRLGSQVMSLAVEGGGGGGVLAAPTLSSNLATSYDGNYKLSWSAIAGATQYQLFESVGGGQERQIYQGNELKWSPSPPKLMGQYSYRVKACNTGCSVPSNSVTVTVVPLPPATVIASTNSSTTGNFQISWSAVNGVQNFAVEEKSPGATNFQQVATTVSTRQWDAVGKSPGVWQYRIRSCYLPNVCGNPSTAVTVTVTSGGLQPPGSITSNDPNSTDGTFTISWQGNPNATYWKLEGDYGWGWIRFVANLTSPMMTLNNYPSGTYRYRALACDSSGCSAPSIEFIQHVNSSNAPFSPSGLAVDPPTSYDGSYQVHWDRGPGDNISYRLEEISPSNSSWHEVANQAATIKAFSAQPEGSYQYRVKACNAAGCSSAGSGTFVLVRLTPDVPVFSTPSSALNGHLVLNWSAPATTTHYYVQEKIAGGEWRKVFVSGDDDWWITNYAVLDRGNGNYQYRAQACSVNCSEWSNIVSTTVTGSSFATMPSTITPSVNQCIPFDTQASPSRYTINWLSGQGAQSYVLRETNTDGIVPVEFVVTGLSKQFSHRWAELPLTRPNTTTFKYEVKACTTASGQQCSPWAGGAEVCLAQNGGGNMPEAASVSTAYDAFGKVRNGDYSDRLGGKLNLLPDTLRGFTGHQHVDDVRLIHMNGRVYDYELGRFLSVDPVIQFPTSTQSMNPYSYILNNPLSGTDPTGYQTESSGCTAETGTHVCGVSGGAQNGASSFYNSVSSTDPRTGITTKTSYTETVSNGTRSFTMTGQSVSNGARPGASTVNASAEDGAKAGAQDIGAVRTPGQDAMRNALKGTKPIFEVAEKTLEIINPASPENLAGGVILGAVFKGVRAAGGFLSFEKIGQAMGLTEKEVARMIAKRDAVDATAATQGLKERTASQIDRKIFAGERKEYWRAEAANNPSNYSPGDLGRMQQGKPPIGTDGYPMELHHIDRTMSGEIEPLTRTEHRLGENYKKNHP